MAETDVSLYMRLHLGDWLRATQGMSAEEIGVHMCLLTAAWQMGGRLPDDQERMSRLSRLQLDRFSTVFRAIEHLWPVVDGFRVAPGMVEQIEKARAAKLAAIARGKAGGKAPHPTQRKPQSRDQVETKSTSSQDEGRVGGDTPNSDPQVIGSHTHRARDPGAADAGAPAPVLRRSEPGKPTAWNVVRQFLAIRGEVLGAGGMGISDPFAQPQEHEVTKAERWLSTMTVEEAKDVEAAFRLACKHVVDGAPTWKHEAMTKTGFLFGAIVSNWRDLREEIHGCAPNATRSARIPPQQATLRTGHARAEDFKHDQVGEIKL